MFAQEQECPAAVIWVIGDGDTGTVRHVFDIGVAVGVEGNRCEIRIADGNEVGAIFFIECIEERHVLIGVEVDIAIGQGLVRCDVVREYFDFDGQAVLFRDFGDLFHDLFP